jgi:ADP-heptose:LPS heptosyltransferase
MEMKSFIKKLFKKECIGNELDHLLEKTKQDDVKSFLVAWNRGLGDVPLGLYAFTMRIRTFIPDAKITFMTRKDLEEVFLLLEGTNVIRVPWWERGKPIDIKKAIKDLNLTEQYDITFDNVNPTKWLAWQIGKVIPKLKWKKEYDNLWRRFNLPVANHQVIGVHVNTETQQYYGFKKDWPIENWRRLFEMVCKKTDAYVILFGLNKTHLFDHPSIIDLRGETSLLEMLSIIKNCCNILIAPDGGVLSIMYYLDIYFPITVVSIWGDSNQGILKQSVPSPNTGFKHIPIIGRGKDISNIGVEEVYRVLSSLH